MELTMIEKDRRVKLFIADELWDLIKPVLFYVGKEITPHGYVKQLPIGKALDAIDKITNEFTVRNLATTAQVSTSTARLAIKKALQNEKIMLIKYSANGGGMVFTKKAQSTTTPQVVKKLSSNL